MVTGDMVTVVFKRFREVKEAAPVLLLHGMERSTTAKIRLDGK